ncbi:hypothetical protein SLEP1_g43017 [Rubroshorea leprosula]|uniref:Uncharacterized protein n=1 Tax=Rubroshorea leprosula TaxID=152421 RepID=A0AAV5LBN3_9ROSI|nr:hypothetical protein SLEP1_g43017 [Rubroshorea leprosula]
MCSSKLEFCLLYHRITFQFFILSEEFSVLTLGII